MTNTTEQAYLELANDAQERYNELDQKLKAKKDQLLELKKELISCYGYVRILDNIYNNQDEIDPNCQLMLEVLREFLSQFAEDNIIKNED
jgi:translation initiation factor 2B subunit (eIF-2B alpha/beta/delta family)